MVEARTSERGSDFGARGRGFDPHAPRRVVSVCKIYPGSSVPVPT